MSVHGSMTTRYVVPVGWRLWCRSGEHLHSWVEDHKWISAPTRPASPGDAHRPGRWALSDLGRCVDEARGGCGCDRQSSAVLGLMEGRGAVIVHGEEGFSAERGSVLCLFDDLAWGETLESMASDMRRWTRLLRRVRHETPPEQRLGALRNAASRRGIPLMSLAAAARQGVLSEFGLVQPASLEIERDTSPVRVRSTFSSPI